MTTRNPEIEMRVFLVRKGIRIRTIQRDLNLKSHGSVIDFLTRRRPSARIAEYLAQRGCPSWVLEAYGYDQRAA